MQMPDKCYVVGLGNCTMDYLGHVPRIIKGGEKGVITKVVEQPGGIMANCLTQLARLGIKTEWIGIIGDDLHGEKILNYFKNDNIITDNIIISKGNFSSYCWILVAPDGVKRLIVQTGLQL
jgi:sugar/nucleoside kinase (ribokinase family)